MVFSALNRIRDAKPLLWQNFCHPSQRRRSMPEPAANFPGGAMDIAEWRKKIDELDRRLVELINQRAECAHEIGKLKRNSAMPIYEPDRERAVYEHVRSANPGPLTTAQIQDIYERVMDVMRSLQRPPQ